MKYLVEVTQKPTIPVTVDADSEQDAIEQVLLQRGDPGDIYYREPSFKVTELNES